MPLGGRNGTGLLTFAGCTVHKRAPTDALKHLAGAVSEADGAGGGAVSHIRFAASPLHVAATMSAPEPNSI